MSEHASFVLQLSGLYLVLFYHLVAFYLALLLGVTLVLVFKHIRCHDHKVREAEATSVPRPWI